MSTTFAEGWGPSEREVIAAIDRADIRTLVRALCVGAFEGDHGPDGFVCPRCGGWSAEVLNPSRWMCNSCDRYSTVMELRRHVAEDAFAALRLATGVR
jgi:hypothetical protein